jgi:surface antigen
MANSSIDVNPPPPPPPYPAAADDYPWPNDAINTLSPLRYDYRECVDFVAWRMNRDIGVTHAPWRWDWTNLSPNGNGDAIAWRGNWQANGWKVDIAPVPGAVAWYGTSAGALGHVAQVQAVSGGNVVLEEYNWGGTHNYDKRTVSQSEPDSYLQAAPK